MPIPIVKVAVCLMRTLAWPFISVVSRRIKHNEHARLWDFYYAFGLRCFQFEAMIERNII